MIFWSSDTYNGHIYINKTASWYWNQGCCAIWDIRPKLILNSNLIKSHSSITTVAVIESFWNFAQSTAVILPCSAQNFKRIGLFKQMLWTNEISQHLSLRWVLDDYPILHKALGYYCGKFHSGNKTVGRSFYLHNENSYSGKMAYLYWNRTQTNSYIILGYHMNNMCRLVIQISYFWVE